MFQMCESETLEDRVVEILSRLPPESLMRFKCIRKSWCNLINSPSFVAKHLNNSMDNKLSSTTCILANRSWAHIFPDKSWKEEVFWSMINLSIDSDEHNLNYNVEDLNIPFPLEDHDFVLIFGYCNGIACVEVGNNILLCNPASREFSKLSDSCLLLPPPKGKFELETTFQTLGFGYDCNANEYKVVRIIENCEYSDDEQTFYHCIALPHTAEVYTTAANCWREIKIHISSNTYSCSSSLYLKGFCYWYAKDSEECILSFDLGDETFHIIHFPSRRESGFTFDYIFLRNESLASFCSPYHPSENSQSCEIWVMDDYDKVKSSWTKLLTVGSLPIRKPLMFWKSDELLMIDSDGRVASYNSSTGNLKYLHIPPTVTRAVDFEALIYVKSIVPLK
ncbi:F-box/kelch-repeat protein At3g06240-like [Pyrus x bretschneideri]|uniref:F-box/kelch-repeat protein At3g06240-like n=1 Tax=Pyrus x bretschneideri TaxID=225117 RepID=UPI00203026B0|nr:F-box/kelch-repeat protein At3g06240-like [Pyrus x bretschneideri]